MISAKAKPSTKWTIQLPYLNHPNRIDDGLIVLDYIDKKRVVGLPRQITYIYDKSDPNENWEAQPELEDLVYDQICHFDDTGDMWCVTCKRYLFETEREALEYLKTNYLSQFREYFEAIINGQELRYVQSKMFLDLLNE